MAPGSGTYEILQGVRRAKAFQLAGYATIRAIVQRPDSTQGPEVELPIDSLRSPFKDDIDMSTAKQASRFWSVWNAIRSGQGDQLPAIIVQHGSRGKRIEDLGWTY
jgi:hypothetical protein